MHLSKPCITAAKQTQGWLCYACLDPKKLYQRVVLRLQVLVLFESQVHMKLGRAEERTLNFAPACPKTARLGRRRVKQIMYINIHVSRNDIIMLQLRKYIKSIPTTAHLEASAASINCPSVCIGKALQILIPK